MESIKQKLSEFSQDCQILDKKLDDINERLDKLLADKENFDLEYDWILL